MLSSKYQSWINQEQVLESEKGSREVKKEEEWKNFQEASMVGRKGDKKKDFVQKVVNLRYLHVFDMDACVLI